MRCKVMGRSCEPLRDVQKSISSSLLELGPTKVGFEELGAAILGLEQASPSARNLEFPEKPPVKRLDFQNRSTDQKGFSGECEFSMGTA
jgi:hypothetical protein